MSDITNIPNVTSKSNFDKAMGSFGTAVSALSAGSGLLDGIFGWSAKRQERAQKRLMQQQQSYWKEQQSILAQEQLDQWNRENEYNDPTNYFKRLMAGAEANGLSKAAVLGDQPGGSVGVSASGVQAPGSTSHPSAGSPSLLAIGSANTLANLRQRSEIENIEAQTEMIRQQTGESSARTNLLEEQAATQREVRYLTHNQALSEESKKILTDLEANYRRLQIDAFPSLNEANLAEIWGRVEKLDIDTANAEKESKYIEARAKSAIDKMKSEIKLNSMLYLVQKAIVMKTNTETAGIAFDNQLKRGTCGLQVDKLKKELEYFDFNQLKVLFSNPTSLIFALANDKPFMSEDSALTGLDMILKQMLNDFIKNYGDGK